MELHSEVFSASIISEIINQIVENAFDNGKETSELILTSSDKENQSKLDEAEEVVENDATNELTVSSDEMIDDEGKNVSSSSEEELQLIDHVENVNGEALSGEEASELILTSSDEENQSKPDEAEEVVENDATNELTVSSDEMIDDEGKNVSSSSEEELQLIDHVENVNGEALSGDGGCEVLQVLENAFDNSNNKEASELILTSSDKENQSKPDEAEEVVENDATNELTVSSDEMIEDEGKNVSSSSEEELQLIDHVENVNGEALSGEEASELILTSSDEENQSKPDEAEEVVENDATNELTVSSDEMIDDEGKNVSSSSEEELQLIDHVENVNGEALSGDGGCEVLQVLENAFDNSNNKEASELILTSSDKENQSKPDEAEEVVENDATNELTVSSDEMIEDEGKNVSSSSEEELQLIDHVENVNGAALSGEEASELILTSSDEENQSKPDEAEEVVENDATNELTVSSDEMIDDEGKNVSSSSEEELQLIDHVENVNGAALSGEEASELILTSSDEENQSKPDEAEEVVENDATNELTVSSDEMIEDEGKNCSSSSEEKLQLIDHVENVNGEAISGDGDCEVLKVVNHEMNDRRDDVFQKIEKSMDIALGDINNAAVADSKNSLSHSSGTASNTITGDARILAEIGSNEGDDFYSNQLLRSKGFSLNSFVRTRILTNLSLYSSTIGLDLKNSEVSCFNLPYQMMENHIIPLFEKAGKVYQLRMALDKENRDNVVCAYVTYTKKEDAEKAIQILDHSKVGTRSIRVVKYTPLHRIFVKGIPEWATKPQLFDKFNYLTTGLENVLLFNSLEKAGKNRGFCFLDYVDNRKARDAKNFISKNKIFGQQLIADWTQRRMERSQDANESRTLHISNLHLNLHSSDLRKFFSVYGEVCEIDKNGNYADVVFRNPEDSQRAAREINKKLLGNDNVEISPKFKLLPKFKFPNFKIKRQNKKPNASRKKSASVTTSPRK